MRKTFDTHEQTELTDSIGAKGVLNAPIVALFTDGELDQYLPIINRLWKRSLVRADLKPSRIRGKRRWFVLLAGERRIRSYKRHVEEGRMPRKLQVVVHEHIDPCDAVEIQLTENAHRRPPPHEAAYAYAEYWVFLETRGVRLSHAGFARRVGSNANTVRNALLFSRLPAEIRQATAGIWTVGEIPKTRFLKERRRRLPYGIAVGLGRLIETGVVRKEQAIEQMVDLALRERRVDVAKFQKDVARQIAEAGQGLLELMSAEIEKAARFSARRRTVEGQISRILTAEEHYLGKVLELVRAGHLGSPEALFAMGAVRIRLLRVAELFEMAFPFIWIRPSRRGKKALRIMREARLALSEPALI